MAYARPMESARAIARLRDLADDVRALGATSLYLFGSTLRDEATGASDVDVFIDYDLRSRFNAFDLVGIKLFLEDALDAPVDVITRDGLHPRMRDAIERSAFRIF